MEQLIYLTQSLNLSQTREGLMCGFPLNITEIKNFMVGSTQKINRIFIRLIFCVLLRII